MNASFQPTHARCQRVRYSQRLSARATCVFCFPHPAPFIATASASRVLRIQTAASAPNAVRTSASYLERLVGSSPRIKLNRVRRAPKTVYLGSKADPNQPPLSAHRCGSYLHSARPPSSIGTASSSAPSEPIEFIDCACHSRSVNLQIGQESVPSQPPLPAHRCGSYLHSARPLRST